MSTRSSQWWNYRGLGPLQREDVLFASIIRVALSNIYELETELKIFCSPICVTHSHVQTDTQLEIIDLQCDSHLKETFASVGHQMSSIIFLAIIN